MGILKQARRLNGPALQARIVGLECVGIALGILIAPMATTARTDLARRIALGILIASMATVSTDLARRAIALRILIASMATSVLTDFARRTQLQLVRSVTSVPYTT